MLSGVFSGEVSSFSAVVLDPTGLIVGAICPHNRTKAEPSIWRMLCFLHPARSGRQPPRTPAMETGIGESGMDLFDEGVFPRSLR